MKRTICILLCVLVLSLSSGVCAEGQAAAETPYATIGEAMTRDYYGYWAGGVYTVLTCRDGVWWLLKASTDRRYREMQDLIMAGEATDGIYEESAAYLDALPVESAEVLSEQPIDGETLNGYVGSPLRDMPADGFSVEWIEAFSRDEAKATGRAESFDLADSDGTAHTTLLYLLYSDHAARAFFRLVKGSYAYSVTVDATEEELRKAAADGSWGDMEIREVSFGGFSRDAAAGLDGYYGATGSAITDEEAAKIRCAGDATKYIHIASSTDERYDILVTGTGCFWRVSVQLDERYRELYRTAAQAGDADMEAAWDAADDYLDTLPTTVTKVETGEDPLDAEKLAALAGKTVREMLADGFGVSYITLPVAEGDPADGTTVASMTTDEGLQLGVHAMSLGGLYLDEIWVTMTKGFFEYSVILGRPEGSPEELFSDGVFGGLTVKSAGFSGISVAALNLPDPEEQTEQ